MLTGKAWRGRTLGAAAFFAFMTVAASVEAGTATATLTVTATVSANCSVTAGSVAFGAYDPLSASAVNQSGTFQVACTKGSTATVGLNLGDNASGSTRRMTNGTDFLTYELYKETARTNVWGNGAGTTLDLSAATSNATQTLTVYGRIAGSQDVGTGSYTDSVTITVTF